MDEREFELVNILGENLGANQRELSRLIDLSLGQTNMLIRRLVSKGYIRITQLNQKKVQYLLTPKGLREKLNKSIKYTLKTINSISLIQGRLKEIIQSLLNTGEEKFYIIGKSDFSLLVEMVMCRLGVDRSNIQHIEEAPKDEKRGIILICQENIKIEKNGNYKIIDVLYELSKDGILVK